MIKDKEITSSTIADFFLTKESLTPKKVQKLVYYAYAWFIALNNQDAENIENVFFEPMAQNLQYLFLRFAKESLGGS